MEKFNSASEHTPEPWAIGAPPPNGEQTVGNADGLMVAVCTSGYSVSPIANARRIVACVNACKGVRTETLEHVPLTLKTIEMVKRIELTEKRCGELLGIVEAVAHIGVDFGYGPFALSDEHVEKARAVIKKIEAQS